MIKFIKWFKEIKTPEDIIQDIMGRGIDWYDYKGMDAAGRMGYWNSAQSLLRNDVFANELNHFIADCLKNIAFETKDFNQVMNIRTGIVFLETLRDRIKSIENPTKEESQEDLNSAI